MEIGSIDLCMVNKRFEYLIVYSEAKKPNIIHTVVYPKDSIKHHLMDMKKRNCIIYNIFHKTTKDEILEVLIEQ